MESKENRYAGMDNVEVARNAKGEYSWKVKLYFGDHQEIEGIIADLKRTDLRLKEEFL